jgi:hypothetical protein
MYAVLMQRRNDLYDMKSMKSSTATLSAEVCCQHLDEDRLCPLPPFAFLKAKHIDASMYF